MCRRRNCHPQEPRRSRPSLVHTRSLLAFTGSSLFLSCLPPPLLLFRPFFSNKALNGAGGYLMPRPSAAVLRARCGLAATPSRIGVIMAVIILSLLSFPCIFSLS